MNAPANKADERIASVLRERSDRLDLSGLGLKAVPPLPEALNTIRGLNLSGNRLKALAPRVAELQHLEWLDLGNNRFESLPPEVARLTKLVSLDLSENRLAALPEAIRGLTYLAEISLYGNCLTEIPVALVQLERLVRLDLAGNRLRTLPPLDTPLGRLKVLDLSRNELEVLPVGLDTLVSLRVLNLSGNRLRSMAGVEALTYLDELDVSKNRLATPPEKVSQLPHLRVLEAWGNPFGPLPEALRGVGRDDLRAQAEAALSATVSGGPAPDNRYFEPVSFFFGSFVAIGGIGGLFGLIELYYKRFGGNCSVTLEFPGGTKVQMANLSRKRALELAQAHESELANGEARLILGEARRTEELRRKTELAVDVLTTIPGSYLRPRIPGAQACQFIIYNGPVLNPVLQGPRAREENVFGDKIDIRHVQNSILNIKSTLNGVTQTIAGSPIDNSKKEELQSLVKQLEGAIEKVPPAHLEDAGAVADMVKETMNKVNTPAPNKKSIEISAKGMVEAAKGIAEVLPIATKIATTIAGMFGFGL